jgi:hypothetical protein
MATEQGQITNLEFTVGTPGTIKATFQNTGTTSITINEAWVNGVKYATTSPALPTTSYGNSNNCTVTVTCPVANGNQYEVKLVSAKGNTFMRTMTAPTA